MTNQFLQNLHSFFTNYQNHGLYRKIVFAPGTAPMKKENSEVADILFATDFETAYFVDPVYAIGGEDSPFQWDLEKIRQIDGGCTIKELGREKVVTFTFQGQLRTLTFLAGDATLPKFQPETFTIFFSGRRIGLYPGIDLRGTPSEYLHEIVGKLPLGGYVVPDRALLDDSVYFVIPVQELGLAEVSGIRVSIPQSEFPKGYSEDTRFIHSPTAPGVGLYKKIKEI